MGLEQIPDNWIGVISAIAGGFLVGIFALVSKYIDKASEAKNVTRTKLEELHSLITAYVNAVEQVNEEAYSKNRLEVNPREIAEHFKKILFDPMTRMSTLQSLYAPRTDDTFLALGDLAVDFIMAATDFVANPESDNSRLEESYGKMMNATTEAIDDVETFIFRSKLIPNQTLLDSMKASWKHAGKRASKRGGLPK